MCKAPPVLNLMKTLNFYILMQIIFMDRQPLRTGEFEQLLFPDNYSQEQVVEDLSEIPDDNEYGFFIECDLKYPAEIKEKTEFSALSLSNKSRP